MVDADEQVLLLCAQGCGVQALGGKVLGVDAGLVAEEVQDYVVQGQDVWTGFNLCLEDLSDFCGEFHTDKIPLGFRHILLDFFLITENIIREYNLIELLNPIEQCTENLDFLNTKQKILFLEFPQILGEDKWISLRVFVAGFLLQMRVQVKILPHVNFGLINDRKIVKSIPIVIHRLAKTIKNRRSGRAHRIPLLGL